MCIYIHTLYVCIYNSMVAMEEPRNSHLVSSLPEIFDNQQDASLRTQHWAAAYDGKLEINRPRETPTTMVTIKHIVNGIRMGAHLPKNQTTISILCVLFEEESFQTMMLSYFVEFLTGKKGSIY